MAKTQLVFAVLRHAAASASVKHRTFFVLPCTRDIFTSMKLRATFPVSCIYELTYMSGVKELNLNKYLVQTSDNFGYTDLRPNEDTSHSKEYEAYKTKAMRNKTPIITYRDYLSRSWDYDVYKEKAKLKGLPIKSYDDWLLSAVPEREYEGKKNSSKIRQDVKTEPHDFNTEHYHKRYAKQQIIEARKAKNEFRY